MKQVNLEELKEFEDVFEQDEVVKISIIENDLKMIFSSIKKYFLLIKILILLSFLKKIDKWVVRSILDNQL